MFACTQLIVLSLLIVTFSTLGHCSSLYPSVLPLRSSSGPPSDIGAHSPISRIHLGSSAPYAVQQRMSLRGGGGVVSETPRYAKLKNVMKDVFQELDSDQDGHLSRDEVKRNAKRFSDKFIDCEVITTAPESVDGHVNRFLAAVDATAKSKLSWDDVVSTFVQSTSYESEEALARDVQQQTSAKRIDDLENQLYKLAKDS